MAEKFFGVENIQVIGLTTTKDLIVSGVSTLGVTTLTDVTAQQLYISGITSVGTGVTINPSPGSIAVSGIITAGGGFIGTIRSSDIVGDISATNITVEEETSDADCNIVFVTESSGSLPPKTNTNLTYDSTSGTLQSSKFSGDGSALTGVIGVGTGVEIQSFGSFVGAAATINISTGLAVTWTTSGIATVTVENPDNANRSVFSSFGDYSSHSETSNSSYSIVGIGTTSYREVAALTGTYANANSDLFGSSVATSADGRTIVVGAQQDEASGNPDNSGVVYVFDRVGTTFTQVGFLTGTYASDNPDYFGYSVATSADGRTIVVGARYDEHPDSISTNPGVVYVFDREGNNFNEVGILTGTYASHSSDEFGYSVAVSADGKSIIVGAYQDNIPESNVQSGVVYVFDREGNNFNEVGILTGTYASDNPDRFGNSVATSADGKIIVVGARADEIGYLDGVSGSANGVVYVFDREENNFNEVGILTGSYSGDASDAFGSSVATSADGRTIVVGAYRDETGSTSDTGVVYVFDREYSVGIGTTFTQVGILTGSYASDTDDRFGNSVATSADGKIIVVGAHQDEAFGNDKSGVVYIFNRQGNDFNEVGILTGSYASEGNDQFGYSVAVSADGKSIISGAPNDEVSPGITASGVAYVFDQDVNDTPLIRVGTNNELFIDGAISIADTTSNAGGARYIGTEAPTSGVGQEGDIWYDISASAQYLNISGLPSLP